MDELYIDNETQRTTVAVSIATKKLPFTIIMKDGRSRSLEQNRTQMMWCREVSKQTGDTPEEVRGYIKLTIGVPVLREASEKYREEYDAILKPLNYEQKMRLMMEPLDYEVTRKMTVEQMNTFMDRVFKHYAENGIALTQPAERTP
jgi:hypothetical protein